MWDYLSKFASRLNGSLTKLYLILINVALAVFAIIFTNVGLLPFYSWGDFVFFILLGLVLAIYRPSWTFAFFVGSLALENINLAPASLGLAMRPYQFFGLVTLVAVAWQIATKRNLFELPKLQKIDWAVLLLVAGGFFSSLFALQKGVAFKQSFVTLSFAALYFLVRIYVQSWSDLKRVTPFFFGSAGVVAMYAIWQNWRFMHDGRTFEVMAGRPNATFTEPDWLGIYATFVLALLFVWLHSIYIDGRKNKDAQIPNQFLNVKTLKIIGIYIFIAVAYIVLILTVARSAWLGAGAVSFVYVCLFILRKDWRGVWQNALGISMAALLAIMMVSGLKLTNFQLGNRATSTGGMQKITIACRENTIEIVPQKIVDVDELANYNCRHINLEEVEQERVAGKYISEVYRPDPNVNIRAEIYRKSWEQIKDHPIMGIGWGNISDVLGKDERGAGLNASNIFLETWLGAGIIGLLSLVVLIGYALLFGFKSFLQKREDVPATFVLLGLTAIVFPNLFNSGIFLAFVWFYWAIEVSMLTINNEK